MFTAVKQTDTHKQLFKAAKSLLTTFRADINGADSYVYLLNDLIFIEDADDETRSTSCIRFTLYDWKPTDIIDALNAWLAQ
jgi:hypothetical protein